jgi:urease accessory protein
MNIITASVRVAISSIILWLISSASAFAHSDPASLQGGFMSGFMHPISGLDHVVAMVAVGLWGAFLGKPAIWILPITFPLVMAFGGALGVAGVPIPYVETGVALSGVVLGLAVLLAMRPPMWVAAAVVGIFAIFHGYAHGVELPNAANPLIYSIGFVIATGLLHLTGIAIGELKRLPWGEIVVRMGGAIISLIGLGFLTHVLSA